MLLLNRNAGSSCPRTSKAPCRDGQISAIFSRQFGRRGGAFSRDSINHVSHRFSWSTCASNGWRTGGGGSWAMTQRGAQPGALSHSMPPSVEVTGHQAGDKQQLVACSHARLALPLLQPHGSRLPHRHQGTEGTEQGDLWSIW